MCTYVHVLPVILTACTIAVNELHSVNLQATGLTLVITSTTVNIGVGESYRKHQVAPAQP